MGNFRTNISYLVFMNINQTHPILMEVRNSGRSLNLNLKFID